MKDLYPADVNNEINNEINTEYDLPEVKEVGIDTNTGEMVDLESLSHWERMCLAAKDIGLTLKDPKKNCKKCYGRGYIGFDSKDKTPVACSCIFKKEDMDRKGAMFINNRKSRRFYEQNKSKFTVIPPKSQPIAQQKQESDFIPNVETVEV